MPAPKNNQNAAKEEAEKASSFLYIRATPADKASWVRTANRNKQKIAQWATAVLNEAVAAAQLKPANETRDNRKGPDHEKVCTGRDLAEAVGKADFSAAETRTWDKDIAAARKRLAVPRDKWQ